MARKVATVMVVVVAGVAGLLAAARGAGEAIGAGAAEGARPAGQLPEIVVIAPRIG